MTSASHGTETGSEAGVDRLQATIAAAAGITVC